MNKTKKYIAIICVIVICILAVGAYGYYHFFCDINAIKPVENITESISPNGEDTITAYLNNRGATTSYAVLCVLSHNNLNKNIYWNYRCDFADIIWLDNNTVQINGVRLENIDKDTYDFRRKKAC